MTKWVMLGPGPSMSQALADRFRNHPNVCAVGNAYELAPWAAVLVASDASWWRKHPAAYEFKGLKYDSRSFQTCFGSSANSGVLALSVLVSLGAESIEMHGFDMHGSHFFGPYVNGCSNTDDARREVHLNQYRQFARMHQNIQVVNCTPGSKLDAFPHAVQSSIQPE